MESHERRHRTNISRTNTTDDEIFDGRAAATDDLHGPGGEFFADLDAGE
jgi:hypothetical protein